MPLRVMNLMQQWNTDGDRSLPGIRLLMPLQSMSWYYSFTLSTVRAAQLIHRQFQIFGSTAGQAIRDAIAASGEPPIEQLRSWFDGQDTEPSTTTDFWALCSQREQIRAAYHKYWNSTKEMTRTGRPVVGGILPVAPSASGEEGKFGYYGEWVLGELFSVSNQS